MRARVGALVHDGDGLDLHQPVGIEELSYEGGAGRVRFFEELLPDGRDLGEIARSDRDGGKLHHIVHAGPGRLQHRLHVHEGLADLSLWIALGDVAFLIEADLARDVDRPLPLGREALAITSSRLSPTTRSRSRGGQPPARRGPRRRR